MRKDRQRYRLEQLEICIIRTRGTKKAAKLLLEKRDWIPHLLNNNNKNENRRPEIISIATRFFQELYTSQITAEPSFSTDGNEIPDIMHGEIKKAVRTL